MSSRAETLLFNLVGKEHQWKAHLLSLFPQCMGNLSNKVFIEKIHDHTLVLGVTHPAWAQELSMMSGQLKFRINKLLGEKRIEEIRFVEKTSAVRAAESPLLGEGLQQLSLLSREGKVRRVNLSLEEERSLGAIKDGELRALLKTFYQECKR